MSDIFLSYAKTDLPRVRPLVDRLVKRGWSVSWDRTIRRGQILTHEIQTALDEARCVIVLWSWDSVVSFWVQNEAAEGHRRGVLVPALLDDVVLPLEFRGIQAANLVGWQGALPHAGFDELAQAVEGFLTTPIALSASASAVSPAAVSPEVATSAQRPGPLDPVRDVNGAATGRARPALVAAFWQACRRLLFPSHRKEPF